MSPAARHPHIEKPSEEQLSDVLANKSPVLRQVYLDAHRLILDAMPGAAYSTDSIDGNTGYGARQYGYDGWGVVALAAYSEWVSLYFMRGADLDDDERLLEGTGKRMRYVKLRLPEQLEQHKSTLRGLIECACTLNSK